MPKTPKKPKTPSNHSLYTKEENDLIIELKEKKGLSWKQIQTYFPHRTQGSLQVHYCRDTQFVNNPSAKAKRRGLQYRNQQERPDEGTVLASEGSKFAMAVEGLSGEGRRTPEINSDSDDQLSSPPTDSSPLALSRGRKNLPAPSLNIPDLDVSERVKDLATEASLSISNTGNCNIASSPLLHPTPYTKVADSNVFYDVDVLLAATILMRMAYSQWEPAKATEVKSGESSPLTETMRGSDSNATLDANDMHEVNSGSEHNSLLSHSGASTIDQHQPDVVMDDDMTQVADPRLGSDPAWVVVNSLSSADPRYPLTIPKMFVNTPDYMVVEYNIRSNSYRLRRKRERNVIASGKNTRKPEVNIFTRAKASSKKTTVGDRVAKKVPGVVTRSALRKGH